jgi:putative holliday junction resolvase
MRSGINAVLSGFKRKIMISLDELKRDLQKGQRLIGLDPGTKTIGVAVSDSERLFATPFETIRRTKFTADAMRLAKITAEFDIAAIIIGFPLNMDGSEGPRAQATRAFMRNLQPFLSAPLLLWDERLSTAAVTRTLLEFDASRARRAAVVDKMAAAYILQGVLDRLNYE